MRAIYRRIKERFRYADLPLRLLEGSRALSRLRNRWPLADPADSLSCDPLFIVSAGRSGTTLLRSMLAAGGEIAIPPETMVIRTAARRFLTLQFLGWQDLARLVVALFESQRHFDSWEVQLHPVYAALLELPEEQRSLARILDEIFRCYAAQQFPEARRWGDQSPINTRHLPWIQRTFPRARYLHMLRDGRDVVASFVEFGLGLERAGERWLDSLEKVRALERSVDPERFLEARYEDLVQEPDKALGLICEFAGVGFRREMLDFWKAPTTIEHRHHEFHRNLSRPLFTRSIGAWKERLSEDQRKAMLSRISEALQSVGYVD